MKNSRIHPLDTSCLAWMHTITLTLFLIAMLILSPQSGKAQSKFLTKMIAKVAKKVGNENAVTTSTLDDIVPTVGIGSNLHPTELGTISQSFFEDWQAGGQQVFVMFTKKNSPGFFKIDGTVSVNGTPVNYMTSGMYSIITGPSNNPSKIEIATSSGQRSSFTIQPIKNPIKLISINGKKDKISLDLSKDVVLELEGVTPSENPNLKVSIAINQVGIKSIYDVCYVRSAAQITIPAAAFRNINITPAGDAVYNYKNSFLSISVEKVENATDVSGNLTGVQYTSSYSDGKFVNVTTEPNLNTGLVAKGKEKLSDGDVEYDFFKPNAFMSRPYSQLKQIGVVSFTIRGKTISEESVIVQERDATKNEEQITKTTTLVFPQQSDETWSGIIETLYTQLTTIAKTELNANILPVDAAPKTEAYKEIVRSSPADTNTKEGFSKSYRNTKAFTATTVSDGLGANSVNERIMKELGADALMSFSLELNVSKDGDFGVMIPKLTFELVGKLNGLITNTKYFTGTVVGKGIPSEDIGFDIVYTGIDKRSSYGTTVKDKVKQTMGEISPEELEKIIRRTDLLNVFRIGLKEVIAKEKANVDYETVWSLQK